MSERAKDASREGIRRRGFLAGTIGAAAGAAAALGAPLASDARSLPLTTTTDPGTAPIGPAAPTRAQAVAGRGALIGIGYETWFLDGVVGWDRPEAVPVLGKYSSLDTSVITQHAEWLTWAGYDFVWIDWSNNLGVNWTNGTATKIMAATDKVFEVYSGMTNPPKIALVLGLDNGQAGTTNFNAEVDRIKTTYLNNPTYANLYVQQDSKPLLSVLLGPWKSPAPTWNDSSLTVRWVGAFRDVTLNPGGMWSWLDRISYANGALTPVAPFTAQSWNGWQTSGSWEVAALNSLDPNVGTSDAIVAWNNPGSGSQTTGTLTSPAFTITENALCFNCAGYDFNVGSDLPSVSGRNVFVLKDASTGDILRYTSPPGDAKDLHVRQWNVADLNGRSVVFSAISNSGMGSDLGWMALDAVYQQRTEEMAVAPQTGGSQSPAGGQEYDAHSRNSGAYLVQQMQNVFDYQPEILLIQQWNEFVRPDQYSVAGSQDIEPTTITTLAGQNSDGWGFYYLNLVHDLITQYRQGSSFPQLQLDTRYP